MRTNDPLESTMARILDEHGIKYTRPETDSSTKSTLDFHLTDYNLGVEVKAWPCARLIAQLVRHKGPAMVLIGIDAVVAFGKMMERKCKGQN